MQTDYESVLRDFFSKYRKFSYKKGENIYRPGDVFESIGFVDQGYVRCYLINDNDKEVSISFFKPVFYLSLMNVLNKSENKYYFECMTDVTVWKAPKNDFWELLHNNCELHQWILTKVLHALGETLTSMEMKADDAYNKIAALIYSMGKSYDQMEINSPHRIIASLVGVSRETASIQVKKLERAGYITQKKGSIKITDPEKFRKDFNLG